MSLIRLRKYNKVIDSAAKFNGVDDDIVAADSASLNMTAAITMEMWIRPSAPAKAYFSLIRKERQYLINCSSTGMIRPHISINDAYHAFETPANTLPFDAWSHVAVVYDGANLICYLNATSVGSIAVTGALFTTANNLQLGDYNAAEPFKGLMDDVRVWNVARTQAQINEGMTKQITTASGLVANWKMDNNIEDSSGFGNHGILPNAITFVKSDK